MTTRNTSHRRDDGFIMVALLVGMAVAAVWMSALFPMWRQQAIRQKEDDLIFRGEQYARAIMMFRCKNEAWPQSIDILVSQKFLRKKWKDPITNDDFLLVPAPVQGQGVQQQPPRGGGAAPVSPGMSGNLSGGIYGVRSKSTATSIKVYIQQTSYNLWPFDFNYAMQRSAGSYCRQQNQGQPGRGDTPGGRPVDGRTGGPGTSGGPGRSGTTGPPAPGRGGPVPPPPPVGRGRGGL
jgi:type II secretory pathway pseudopilin PulG